MDEKEAGMPNEEEFAILEDVNESGETIDDILEGRFAEDNRIYNELNSDNIHVSLKRDNLQKITTMYIIYYEKRIFSIYHKIDFPTKRMLKRKLKLNRRMLRFQFAWDCEYGFGGEWFGIVPRNFPRILRKQFIDIIAENDLRFLLNIVDTYPFYHKNLGKYSKDICSIAIIKTFTYKQNEFWVIDEKPFADMVVDLIACEEGKPSVIDLLAKDSAKGKMRISFSHKPFENFDSQLTLKNTQKYSIDRYYYYQQDDGKGMTFTRGLELFFKRIPRKLFIRFEPAHDDTSSGQTPYSH